MKRILALTVSVIIFAAVFVGCSNDGVGQSDNINIVCTVYPVYDWLNQIIGEVNGVSVTMLGANGTDIHSYQPTAADIAAITKADLTVVIGGVSDSWVSDNVRQSGRGAVLSLLETVEPDLLHADEHDGDCEHNIAEYDEHVWLSPNMAMNICKALGAKLSGLDSENAAAYKANLDKYLARLAALDEEYAAEIAKSDKKAVVIADRYPFRYLMHDYSIDCTAAYDGCEAESEADFETVARLAAALDEHELNAVLIIDGSSDKLAQSVITASNRKDCRIFTLDSMQSTTAEELNSAEGYIEIMTANLAAIKSALER